MRDAAPADDARCVIRRPRRDESSWKARLARAVNFVDVEAATAYLDSVVRPALTEVAHELEARGLPSQVNRGAGGG